MYPKTKGDSVSTFQGLWVGVCSVPLLWTPISARLKACEERLPRLFRLSLPQSNICHWKRIPPYIATNPFTVEFTYFLLNPEGRCKIAFSHPLLQRPSQTRKTSLNCLTFVTSVFAPVEVLRVSGLRSCFLFLTSLQSQGSHASLTQAMLTCSQS